MNHGQQLIYICEPTVSVCMCVGSDWCPWNCSSTLDKCTKCLIVHFSVCPYVSVSVRVCEGHCQWQRQGNAIRTWPERNETERNPSPTLCHILGCRHVPFTGWMARKTKVQATADNWQRAAENQLSDFACTTLLCPPADHSVLLVMLRLLYWPTVSGDRAWMGNTAKG